MEWSQRVQRAGLYAPILVSTSNVWLGEKTAILEDVCNFFKALQIIVITSITFPFEYI